MSKNSSANSKKTSAKQFCVGAGGYVLLELVWRGHSHWTMALAGGASLLVLGRINKRMRGKNVVQKSLAGAGAITGIEFFTGCIVNKLADMRVWDYSRERMHVMGQVCPKYTALWFLLCLPLFPIIDAAERAPARRSKLRRLLPFYRREVRPLRCSSSSAKKLGWRRS